MKGWLFLGGVVVLLATVTLLEDMDLDVVFFPPLILAARDLATLPLWPV